MITEIIKIATVFIKYNTELVISNDILLASYYIEEIDIPISSMIKI